MPRYNLIQHPSGENTSMVPGWVLTYPSMCNGHLADLGFVSSTGWGTSEFVHFDADGEPYGFPLTQAARARFKAMRRDFKFTRDEDHVAVTGCGLTQRDFHPEGDQRCADGGEAAEHPVS